MPKLRIVIKKDGTAQIEGLGFAGKKCEDATNELIAAIGAVPEGAPEYDADYYALEEAGEEALG